jgi:hypothetical protein
MADLDEIRRIWAKEPDEWVLKAINENSSGYPEEVLAIIKEEAYKRGLIKYKVASKNGTLVSDLILDEDGERIKAEIAKRRYNLKFSVILSRTLLSIPVILGFGLLTFFSEEVLKINTRITAILVGVPMIALLAKIWGFKNPFN